MSGHSEELFRRVISNVFNGWTALQLAVEHGMGGSDGYSKANGIVDSVLNLYKDNSNIDWQDISDLLSDLMDEEFDTLCEDDSCDEIGYLLWEFHKLCVAGNVEAVEAKILELPPSGHWLSKSVDPIQKIQDVCEGENDSTQSNRENMEVDAVEVDADPGWTKITKKRK